ncbi:MAG: cytochrome c, partial [Ramlibacter sp.]
MKRWIKWTVGIVAAAVLLAAAATAVGYQLGLRKMARTVSVAVKAVPYATDAQSLQRGKYLFESRGCAECHGVNGAGRQFVNDGKGVRLAGPNITAGGVTARYQPEDWVRTIRHGVKPGGQPLMVMPSEDYNRFTDQDLAAVVAHVRSLPAAQGGAAVIELPLPVRVLYG